MILLVCGQKRTTCSNQRKNLGDRFISILPILPLCSEFGAFNRLSHCFFTLQWYPATKDRHGWHQWSLVYFSYLWLYLSFFIYQSYGPSCASARSLVRSTVFCIVFCASVVSSYQDRPRRTQTKDQRSFLASGPCLVPIVKPAVFNGSPPKGRRTAVKNTDETFFRHETCLKKIAPKFHSDMMRSKKQQDDSHKTNCKTAAKNWTAIPFWNSAV